MDRDQEISDLQTRLRAARESYYNLSPIIDDALYDGLKARLEELDPQNKEVVIVGAEAPKFSVWEKVEHEIPMGSLNKVNAESEFREWAAKTGSEQFTITHKLDGSSLELVYINGKLARGITRGDGKVGEDITSNVMKIPSIPKQMSTSVPDKVIVRGEVVMLKSVFERIYASEYANPRNTAAGKLRDKKGGGKDCANLEFYGFDLIFGQEKIATERSKMLALEKLGFYVPWSESGSIDRIVELFSWLADRRGLIDYEIDGSVISVDNTDLVEELGSLNMRPRGRMAWKFAAETSVATMRDVKWQVGPTGRVTPVAVLDPVKIGGVTITSISLHNLKMFRELQLAEDHQVLVSRRNDVIPYIERNLSISSEEE
jgi:DNA ligase (NAD+)